MAGYYTLQQGDCISSLACKSGLTQDLIWDHPLNADLKSTRKDRYVLMPGDSVYIPDKRPRVEPRATDMRHKFVKIGAVEHLRIVLLDEYDQPRKAAKYEVTVEGKTSTGQTDGSGMLDVLIPATATDGVLVVEDGEETYQLKLGYLNPVTDDSGVQMRLSNLAYFGSPCTNEQLTPAQALQRFQQQHELLDGSADDVAGKIKDVHQS